MKDKNIYQKIQEIRLQLSKKSIKKSGKNTFANYEYFELSDFLNPLNELMDITGVMTQFILQDNRAVLHIINSDKPEEKITFYTPIASAEGKGTNAIQQLGSQITYLRRYLFMIAFEIAESDTVDNQKPLKNVPQRAQNNATEEKEEKTTNGKCEICGASGKYHRPDCPNKE